MREDAHQKFLPLPQVNFQNVGSPRLYEKLSVVHSLCLIRGKQYLRLLLVMCVAWKKSKTLRQRPQGMLGLMPK